MPVNVLPSIFNWSNFDNASVVDVAVNGVDVAADDDRHKKCWMFVLPWNSWRQKCLFCLVKLMLQTNNLKRQTNALKLKKVNDT